MKKSGILFLLICLWSIAAAQNKPSLPTGQIRGRIFSGTERLPVSGALIRIVNDTLSTHSDSVGNYLLENVRPGYNTLYVEAEGYHGQVTNSFPVTTSAPAVVDIELKVMLVDVAEVVVSASQLVPTVESPVSMRRIGTEEIDMTPGANRDISRVVQSAPGVLSVSMGNRNDVLVRGGGGNENRYFLDGIEIPVLNHFAVQGGSGGRASLVNTDLLRSANFYTGAFPAQLANGLSSVLDMRMGTGNSEAFRGKLVLGASDFGVSLDTPVSRNGKTTLLASFRRSYLQMLFDILDLPFLPTYNDYQFKLSSALSDRDEIYLIGLGSFDKNRLNNGLRDLTPSRRYILGYLPENDQSGYTTGIGYRHGFTGGQFRAVVSRDYLRNRVFKNLDNPDEQLAAFDIDSRESNFRTRAEVELWNVGGFRFTGGIGGGNGHYRTESFRRNPSEGDNSGTEKTNRIGVTRYEFFATLSRYFFEDKLSVLVGLRADGMDYSRLTANPFRQLSPRLSLSWQAAPKWTLSGTIARYYQEPPYTTLGYVPEAGSGFHQRDELRYAAVNQYIAGVEFTPGPQSSIRLEGFLKQYDHLPVSLIDSLPVSASDFEDFSVGDVPVRSVGKGRVWGMEFSYRNLDLRNTVVNLSYTLFYGRVNRPGADLAPTSVLCPSSWDARHIITLSAIRKFPRNWAAGAKWYFMGGLPYTPYNVELSSQIDAWGDRLRPYPDYMRYNGERTAPYHQLDIRVDKVWYFRHWRLGFYLDIQNAYNYKSRGQEILTPQTDATGAYIPDPDRSGHYLMQHIANDQGGTILPTLGITIEW